MNQEARNTGEVDNCGKLQILHSRVTTEKVTRYKFQKEEATRNLFKINK